MGWDSFWLGLLAGQSKYILQGDLFWERVWFLYYIYLLILILDSIKLHPLLCITNFFGLYTFGWNWFWSLYFQSEEFSHVTYEKYVNLVPFLIRDSQKLPLNIKFKHVERLKTHSFHKLEDYIHQFESSELKPTLTKSTRTKITFFPFFVFGVHCTNEIGARPSCKLFKSLTSRSALMSSSVNEFEH